MQNTYAAILSALQDIKVLTKSLMCLIKAPFEFSFYQDDYCNNSVWVYYKKIYIATQPSGITVKVNVGGTLCPPTDKYAEPYLVDGKFVDVTNVVGPWDSVLLELQNELQNYVELLKNQIANEKEQEKLAKEKVRQQELKEAADVFK